MKKNQVLLLMSLLGSTVCFAQLGQIDQAGDPAVFDLNGDGYVSLTSNGFNPGAGYTPDQFEIPMFGLPIVGEGDVEGDASGPSCSNTDLIPDDLGYSAYAILKDGNLIFRFRVANHAQNVPGYSVLIDTDGNLGPADPDFVEGARNPGFEIDITLIKGPSAGAHGVKVYDIDGGSNTCRDVLSYSISTHHQRAIGDLVGCNTYAYFYDFYVPFADLTDEFGITTETQIRFVALTNLNATCAMSGTISDVGGVDDDEYGSLFDAVTALSDSQCPTTLSNLSEDGEGFLEGATENPAFDEPIREGDRIISGTAEPTATVTIKLYQDENSTDPLDIKAVETDANGVWSIEFDDPLVGGMVLSAVAQLPGTCGSGSNNTDPDNEIVLVEVIVVTNYPPVLTQSVEERTYTENGPAIAIDPGVSVSYPAEADYPEGTKIAVDATISIAGNYASGEDELQFTDQPGITGNFDIPTGTLTLASADKVDFGIYEAALRSVAYFNSSENPDAALRTIQFVIDDGYPEGVSNVVEIDIVVVPVNDSPVMAGDDPHTVTYTNAGGGTIINETIFLTDADNPQLQKAEIALLNPLDGPDEELQFTDPNLLISVADFTGGILTLEGAATIAAYQQALRNVLYVNNASPVTSTARQFSFRVFDGTDWSNTYNGSFINFEDFNNPPVVKDENGDIVTEIFFGTTEDTAADICMDIEDPDGDPVEITLFDSPTTHNLGQVSGHADFFNCLVYTPFANLSGDDEFTVTICDQPATGGVACIEITVHVNVIAVNDPPMVVEKAVDADEKTTTPISFDVTDLEADVHEFTSASSAKASIVITGDFTFDYTPNTGFVGTDQVTVKVTDINDPAVFDEGIITVNVTDLPEAPVIIGDNGIPVSELHLSTVKNQPFDFCVSAFDPDQSDIVVFESSVKQSLDASALTYLPAFSGDPSGNRPFCFSFTPEVDLVGISEWVITICDDSDPSNPLCESVTVYVTVEQDNFPPDILINGSTDLTVEVPENVTSEICVEVDDVENDEHLVTSGLSLNGIGSIHLREGAVLCFDYTPPAGFLGEDEVEIVVCDLNDGSVCTTAVISVMVIEANEPPVAVENGLPIETLALTTAKDTPLDFCFEAEDPEGDLITLQGFSNVSGGGELVLSGDGDFCLTFTPAAEFAGTSVWEMEICDDATPSLCGTFQVEIEVTPANGAPVVQTTEVQVPENTTTTICVEVEDIEDDEHQLTEVASLGGAGTIDLGDGDLCFDYTPPAGFLGEDEVEIVVCDLNDGSVCTTAVISVMVIEANEPPTPVENGLPTETLALSTAEDTPLDFCFEAEDPEGDLIMLQGFSNLSGGGELELNGDGVFCLTFTPVADFAGSSVWEIEICDDATPSLCGTFRVEIEVTPVNDAPVVQTTEVEVPENTTTPICVEVEDIEDDEHQLTEAASLGGVGMIDLGDGDLCFDYTPPKGFLGKDEVEVTICDVNDNSVCSTGIIAVNVINVNDPPVNLVNGEPSDTLRLTTAEDTPLDFCFEVMDPDGDNVVLGSFESFSGRGSLAQLNEGDFCFSYTPPKDFNGVSRWDVTICDDASPSLCVQLITIIDITAVNDPPVAERDTLLVRRNKPGQRNALDNDWDVEGDQIDISFNPVAGPQNGVATISQDGVITYTSNATFKGTDSLVYEIKDRGEPPAANTGVVVFLVDDLPFTVYQTVSPNGDGLNDYWHIEGIDFYPENFIRIFDRFSNVVFEMSGYDNAEKVWSGQANHGLGSKQLADGTYYYSISLGPTQETYSGFVVLKLN